MQHMHVLSNKLDANKVVSVSEYFVKAYYGRNRLHLVASAMCEYNCALNILFAESCIPTRTKLNLLVHSLFKLDRLYDEFNYELATTRIGRKFFFMNVIRFFLFIRVIHSCKPVQVGSSHCSVEYSISGLSVVALCKESLKLIIP